MQNAIMNVQKQQQGKLTIIMIAHRLQTIMTADNLLYLESPTCVRSGQKGTAEYDEIMHKLKSTNYAHQADDANENQESGESEEEADDDKNEVQSAYSKGSNSMVMSKAARRESKMIQKEIKRASKLTPAAVKAQKEIDAKKGQIVQKTTFISQKAGWGRLA